MATRLPGTNNDGAFLKSENFADHDIVGFKILAGGSGIDGNPVVPGDGLPITSNGDVLTGAATFATNQLSVGSTTVSLPLQPVTRMVTVKAHNGNLGNVYIGGSSVAPNSGFELGAGESLTILVDNANKVYCIASPSGQRISWIAI
jgi:uncharacterized Zn-binding protein involved in type VI secretion